MVEVFLEVGFNINIEVSGEVTKGLDVDGGWFGCLFFGGEIVSRSYCCCHFILLSCCWCVLPLPSLPWSRSLSASAGRVGGGVKKQTVSLY